MPCHLPLQGKAWVRASWLPLEGKLSNAARLMRWRLRCRIHSPAKDPQSCHCEPVTDVTGVAIRILIKILRLAALAQDDSEF